MDYNKDLRYDVLRILQMITVVATILSTISNFINKRPFGVAILPFFATLFIFVLLTYQKKNVKNRYISKLVFLTFFNVCYIPFAWFTSPGSSSAIGYYAILTIIMSVFFVEKVYEFILPIFTIIVSVIMLRLEYITPEIFTPYPNRTLQLNDLTFNYIIVACVLFALITYINRQYSKEKEQLYNLSITDELTGVYNRRHVLNVIEELSNNSSGDNDFTLLFLDINNFKEINDTYGHLEGDEVLIELGRILLNMFNVSGRFGGDEFFVVLPGLEIEDAFKLSNTLKDKFLYYAKGKGYSNLSLSIGATSSNDRDVEEIIREADSYMYEIKHKNKN